MEPSGTVTAINAQLVFICHYCKTVGSQMVCAFKTWCGHIICPPPPGRDRVEVKPKLVVVYEILMLQLEIHKLTILYKLASVALKVH